MMQDIFKLTMLHFRYLVNKCYGLWYRVRYGRIVDPLLRYRLQILLDSEEPTERLKGVDELIQCSAGNDRVSDCLYRMYEDDGFGNPVRWYQIGLVQLKEDTRVQEIIDDLKKIYIPNVDNANRTLFYLRKHLSIISYWMYYHPRIGSQCCGGKGEFAECGNPHGRYKTVRLHDKEDIYTWNWRKGWYDFPVPAEEYWEKNKKPDISVLRQ